MNARGEKYAISAVVPTHNRSAYLRKCLRALEKQTLPPQQYEVIVVDNDSIDDTPSVVKSFCERNSIFRYVHEAKPGVAIARNTGVRVSSFDFVAQTDDDAEPDPTWLERILARFREHPNDVGIVGGEVLPIWEAERPAWLSDALLRPLSAGLMWSTEARFLRANEWLIEVNSAYRKAALLRIGGFPNAWPHWRDAAIRGIVRECADATCRVQAILRSGNTRSASCPCFPALKDVVSQAVLLARRFNEPVLSLC